jgi:transposase
MNQLPTFFIGIDVSKNDFTTACMDNDRQWIIKKFPNTEAGIKAFIKQLEDPLNTHVVLEATGNYSMKLTFGLCQNDIKCSVLNPKQSKGFIQGVMLSTTKTDEKDACALALYGQCNDPKPFVLPSDKILESKQLRTLLRQLKKQKRAIENQLHALEFHVQPLEFVIQTLRDSLALCEQQIKQTKERICKLNKQAFDKAYKLAISVKGVGPAIANALLVATNGLEDFDNYKQLAKYVGACPTQFESGSSVKRRGSIAKTGDADIRALLYMGARSAKRYNTDCKRLYDRLKSKGKCHKVAMLAVCNKMLRQVFAVVKSGQPFDNEYYLKIQNS